MTVIRPHSHPPPLTPHPMVLVRLLLFLSLTTIGISLALYAIKRDRVYLRFIVKVVKFTLFILLAILLMFAAERLLVPVVGPFL